MRAGSIDHNHHEGAVIHVQPITTSNEFIRSIPRKRAVRTRAKIGFIKSAHEPQTVKL